MPTLYVTEQNAILRKTGDRLIVEKDDEVLLEVPCLKLDTVLLFGNVQFTTQAAVEMLDHGIEMAMLSMNGRLRGQLTPPKAKNVYLRMGQYDLARSEERCLAIAREIVSAKIGNSVAVLRRYRANHPEAIGEEALAPLDRATGDARSAASLDSLRGIEGSAAAAYLKLLANTVPEEVRFQGRSRRPPRDPVNALLSFGYVLVGNELQSLLDAMGFDPYIGFYHQLDYGRPSLALDLLEELRAPLVDRFTAKVFNQGTLTGDDFVSSPQGGVYLGQEAKRTFFAAWEQELASPFALGEEELSFREVFRRQAGRLARAVQDGAPYEAFRFPC